MSSPLATVNAMSNAHRFAGIARSVAQEFGRAVLRGVLGRSAPTRRDTPPGTRPEPSRRRTTSGSRPGSDSGSRASANPSSRSRGSEAVPSRIEYAARDDGRPDPGEIVWAWVPYEEDASRGKDRPVLVIAIESGDLLCLPTTSKDHDRDAAQEARAGRYWMDIGSGAWDARRRPSEVRLDRVVRLEATSVRREGAALDEVTFERVVTAMRQVRRGPR